MRLLVALALVSACGVSKTLDGAGDASADVSDPSTTASNLYWDTTTVPTARWTPAQTATTQTIRLYSDSSCTTLLAAVIDLAAMIDAHALPLTIAGAMSFSIETISATGTTTACSPDVGRCPTNYLPVAPRAPFTSSDHCVAKFEMKDRDGVAMPTIGVRPWGMLTLAAAKAACAARGARYHLITNAEWMATARDIELVAVNWSTTATPFLSKGLTDDCSILPSVASTDDDPCAATMKSSCAMRQNVQFRFNRTMVLSQGGVLWDFSGNMFEMIDTVPRANAVQGAHPGEDINGTSGATFTPPMADVDYKSANTTHRDDMQNVGILYAEGPTAPHVSRGGDFCGFSGIYAYAMINSPTLHNVGFRCVYD